MHAYGFHYYLFIESFILLYDHVWNLVAVFEFEDHVIISNDFPSISFVKLVLYASVKVRFIILMVWVEAWAIFWYLNVFDLLVGWSMKSHIPVKYRDEYSHQLFLLNLFNLIKLPINLRIHISLLSIPLSIPIKYSFNNRLINIANQKVNESLIVVYLLYLLWEKNNFSITLLRYYRYRSF